MYFYYCEYVVYFNGIEWALFCYYWQCVVGQWYFYFVYVSYVGLVYVYVVGYQCVYFFGKIFLLYVDYGWYVVFYGVYCVV